MNKQNIIDELNLIERQMKTHLSVLRYLRKSCQSLCKSCQSTAERIQAITDVTKEEVDERVFNPHTGMYEYSPAREKVDVRALQDEIKSLIETPNTEEEVD